ncbi:MAG: hypothetical protein WA390_00790 [Nitrososphaeraceae archaeon]|nr:hypothetical protein [Nitrososphaeraceae archaeon]MDW0136325.1 hypothetical protein [Nitrososphaeraceae archaeon]MDW0138705.1 hypothetical protein [Nitrososphaeraceae archaeon]MDW0142573.1 hypothetical protein [Nitrososphaeraceae archaeon]MDW0144917.1 hypothetical protein [Nitrososphaeraceae archaeon]
MPTMLSLSKKLSHELSNLDIDEGVRIESTKIKNRKMYINKRPSGCFVAELVYSNPINMTEIRFYVDVKQIHKLIDNIFGKQYSVTIY